ncbi:MAG: glycosyltransferase family 39 protein [candidate division WWE3 bacterium]|nr:glycosyltransferase family 39 protein [candidate division WWE3 bacterium]
MVLLAYLVVPPTFKFPVDDDWVYIQSVQKFLSGNFRVSEYARASTFFQTILGFIYSSIVGFSIPKIHFLVAIFSIIGVVVAYWHLRVNYKINSAYLPLILFLNPLFFFLSYSFGTDVLFTVLLILSIAFYEYGLKSDKLRFLILGSIVAACSICVRQIGAALPAAALIYYLYLLRTKEQTLKISKMLAITIPAGLGLIAYFAWFHFVQPPTIVQQMQSSHLSFNILTALDRWTQTLMYLGLLLPPVTILIFKPTKRSILKFVIGAVVAVFIAGVYWLKFGKLMFYTPALLTINGFAPNSIDGTKMFLFPHPLQLGVIATTLSVIGVALFVANFKKRLDLEQIVALILVAFFPFMMVHCDRYYLPVVSLLTLSFGKYFVLNSNFSKICAAFVIAFFVGLNLIWIYEFKQWNEARWQLGQNLLRQKVNINEIDGGYEWDAWNLAEKHIGQDLDTRLGYDYFPKNPRYVISFRSWLTDSHLHLSEEKYCLLFNIKCDQLYLIDTSVNTYPTNT